jgi:hypothetical protein
MCNPTQYLFPGCSHFFFYGMQHDIASHNYLDFPMYPALTALEALSMDLKIDDGKPGTGIVMAPKNAAVWSGSCATTAVVSTAIYDTTTSGKQCALQFRAKF